MSDTDFADFLAILDEVDTVSQNVLSSRLHGRLQNFADRHWIARDAFLTHTMAPFLDGEIEVEVEIDECANAYSYRSPQDRSRRITRPLAEIRLYRLCVEQWLDDLARLIGIDPGWGSMGRERLPEHLWHLGNRRVTGAIKFAPIFVARQWHRVPAGKIAEILCDSIWQRGGIVLTHRPPAMEIPGRHAARKLGDFLAPLDGGRQFDPVALDRVLLGLDVSGSVQPDQFLRDGLLKLPHFAEPRRLSDERLAIVKEMWGQNGKTPPIRKWVEANVVANTGYQSFDDAFDGPEKRDEIFAKVGRGQYQLRRNP